MSFDALTRNRLAKLVGDTRTVLTGELLEQCQSVFGIAASGEIRGLDHLGHLDDAERATAIVLRERLAYLMRTHSDEKDAAESAVTRLIREQAFTIVNRLAALRMAEKRGLIAESVGKGYQSTGFKVFETVARTGLGDTYHRYRQYLECLCHELALDLGVLFDHRASQGVLFPREPALLECLHCSTPPKWRLCGPKTRRLVGYTRTTTTLPSGRRCGRSSAPRNSRELAVRNQFFTPRYVVEFLTDNTLGRIWYEMTKGQTRLKDQCRFRVRRPHEVFLSIGEAAPETSKHDDLGQEQLFQQAVHLPHRDLKDPREIRMLDPACGSMHFGLYAFDLLEVMYNEAWDISRADKEARKSLDTSFSTFVSFAAQYADKAAFLVDVPRLIIEHNLHGIDIDPRAAQIAGLSLWLRAQRSWQQQGLRPQDRPRIRRSNIVCAEPMPGETSFLNEFIEVHLAATPEHKLLGQLVRRVFDAMKLAGEAGSLLKIEKEIAGAVAEAKQKWLAAPKLEQGRLFSGGPPLLVQKELGLDVTGITDESFWTQAEERIYAALQAYAEQAEHGSLYQRRLFADDAARGFAFIDVCRQQYDVVLMNPPFGEAPEALMPYLDEHFQPWNKNILCAFLEREACMLTERSFLASVMDRSLLNKSSYDTFRKSILLAEDRLSVVLDLGWEVLDANVEVAACIVDSTVDRPGYTSCFDVRDVAPDYKHTILSIELAKCDDSKRAYRHRTEGFSAFPNHSIVYDLPEGLLTTFVRLKGLKALGYPSFTGHQLQSERHFRNFWEISEREQLSPSNEFCHLYNGGEFSRFTVPPREVVRFGSFSVLSSENFPSYSYRIQNKDKHFKRGVGFGVRGEYLDAHLLPDGVLFSVEGQVLPVGNCDTALFLVGLLNSAIASRLLNTYAGQHKYSGYVNLLPCPSLSANDVGKVASLVREAILKKHQAFSTDETCLLFRLPRFVARTALSIEQAGNALEAASTSHAARFDEIVALIDKTLSGLYSLHDDASLSDLDSYSRKIPPDTLPGVASGAIESCKVQVAQEVLSYAVGCVCGRWDIRCATGEQVPPASPDPFASFPIRPPGQLRNEQGLPITKEDVRELTEGSWNYPVEIPWDGILVDDPGHPRDLEARLQRVLQLIWNDRAEAVERDACKSLGVRTLRDYLRKPTGFFADHLKRYSKSRRQAPIYWPLSTSKGSYTLWIYCHRLTDQTLHSALADLVEPKIRATERAQADARAGNRRQQIDDLADLLLELQGFRDELERVIRLPWKPNLNDGVLITACPLWKLFRLPKWQHDLKACWEELVSGTYEWAHLALSIWPDRVKEVCEQDRSIAIAHDLERLFKAPAVSKKPPKARRKGRVAESG